MKIDSFSFSNKGGRSYNEDYVGKKEFADGAMFVLADGLGGHQQGELASRTAVETLLDAPAPESDCNTEEWLSQHFKVANEKILELSRENGGSMKSTAVALRIKNNKASWAHVGDSRLYFLHKCEIESITEDHSVAYKKYKAGEITRAEIATDEDQSRLLKALGNVDRFTPDLSSNSEPIDKGDGFLLCSDGAWEYLYDNEVLIDFLKAENAEEWGELLLLRIIERVQPDNDNLSLITVMIH